MLTIPPNEVIGAELTLYVVDTHSPASQGLEL